MDKLASRKLTGPQKAAILLLTMGEEFTSSIFKKMDERSIKMIGKHMSEINYIPSSVSGTVVNEYLANWQNDSNIMVSGRDFLKEVVSRSLDKETAREVFRVIGSKIASVPFSDLADIPSQNLYNLIHGEYPQTIAVIISYLPQEKAAEVLGFFPEEVKHDIALRIVQIGQVDEEIVRELDEVITRDLSNVRVTVRKFNGIETLANILNEVDGSTEESVLSFIENEDSELAGMIRQKMFLFEDLMQIDDRDFRYILQNVNNEVLTKALRTATEEVKEKVFSNLSQRASEMLKEDIEVMGPIKLSEVEEAQQEMIKAAKKLETEGKIVLTKGKEDVFV